MDEQNRHCGRPETVWEGTPASRTLNNNFTGENEPSKTMRQLKGLIRLVKGGADRVCLAAVLQTEGKREADQRRKGGE